MSERPAPTDADPLGVPSPSDEPTAQDGTALPDYAARDAHAPPAPTPGPERDEAEVGDRPFPPWAIVSVVALLVVGLIAGLVIVAGALDTAERLRTAPTTAATPTDPGPRSTPATGDPSLRPGSVDRAGGAAAPDGSFSDPATVGEDTLSWPTWDGGTVHVRATEVDPDAELPHAPGTDVVEDGHQLVLVTLEISYEGPGQFQPLSEMWFSAQTDLGYATDVLPGMAPDAIDTVGALRDGEHASARCAFVLVSTQMDGARIVLQPYDGEPLHYALG